LIHHREAERRCEQIAVPLRFAHPIGGLKAAPFGVENKREKEVTCAHFGATLRR
jgi:hypothetical protein